MSIKSPKQLAQTEYAWRQFCIANTRVILRKVCRVIDLQMSYAVINAELDALEKNNKRFYELQCKAIDKGFSK